MMTFSDVLAAHDAFAKHLPETPAFCYPMLDRAVGVGGVVVKHENHQPTGAFKVRGSIALFAARSFNKVCTASTGNHAQGIAYAAALHNVPAVIVVPEWTPQFKVNAISEWGAEVIRHGANMSEAAAYARTIEGHTYISPTEPEIVAGHAGIYLELLGQYPDLHTIFVPVGSGSGAAGACIVRNQLAPHCRIIGVQSSAAPAAWRSWRTGAPAAAESHTTAAGLATCESYANTQDIMQGLDDFVLVEDSDIDAARTLLATCAHTLAEGGGAAALAGLCATKSLLSTASSPVAVVVTGGNADARELATLGATAREKTQETIER